MASKLKALYQRNKGRDLFDLTMSEQLKPNYKVVTDLCKKMFEKDGHPFKREVIIKNILLKLSNKKFCNDIKPLISSNCIYDISSAGEFVIDKYL